MSYLPSELQYVVASYLPLAERYRQGKDNQQIYQSILDEYADLLQRQESSSKLGFFTRAPAPDKNIDGLKMEIIKQDDVEAWNDIRQIESSISSSNNPMKDIIKHGACRILQSYLQNPHLLSGIVDRYPLELVRSIAKYPCMQDLLLQPKYRKYLVRALEFVTQSGNFNDSLQEVVFVIQMLIGSGTSPRELREIIIDTLRVTDNAIENTRFGNFMQSIFPSSLSTESPFREGPIKRYKEQDLVKIRNYLDSLL